jgi:PAS domain S-box-containing protein
VNSQAENNIPGATNLPARGALLPSEQRILLLAPTANDARLAAEVLRIAGLVPQICSDMLNLCAEMERGVGAILLAEETLNPDSEACLVKALAQSPPWSDIPMAIITSGNEMNQNWLRRLRALEQSGNVILIERPFRPETLVSTCEVALRARQRQYQVRDLLEERARNEAALRQTEQLFRALAENIPHLAWMTDEHGAIFWYNRRWYDYTGTTLEEMKGWGWLAVQHPDYVEGVTEKFKRSLAKGEFWEDTFPLRGKNGHYRWFLSRAFPIRDPENRITGWFGTNTDITELRNAQLALDEAHSQMEQQNQLLEKAVCERTARLRDSIAELEHFSYTITHDMRAPLRAMQGFGRMLQEELGKQMTPAAANFLQRILEGADRMDVLIRDALQYTKILRGEINLRVVDPAPLLRGVVESYPDLQPPRAEIEIMTPLPTVLASEAGLLQCFSNLLTNAAKFVEPGTTPRIRVWAEHRELYVRFWFEDNGIGIPAQYQDRIFDMFQKLDKRYDGTGIGLALVRKAAERMGGAVGVESEPGKGSRFWLDCKTPDS